MSNFNLVLPLLPESLLHGAGNESLHHTRKLDPRAGVATDEKDTKPLTVLEEEYSLEFIKNQKVIVEV